MAGKQIIVAGIDVSGCECIIEDYQRANNFEGRYEHLKNVCELGERGAEYYNLFCKDNLNCYYKQLQRKEQECEKLKKVGCKFKNYCTCDTEKFLQVLIEIKEIAEEEVHNRMLFADKKSFGNFNKILQKINEVI